VINQVNTKPWIHGPRRAPLQEFSAQDLDPIQVSETKHRKHGEFEYSSVAFYNLICVLILHIPVLVTNKNHGKWFLMKNRGESIMVDGFFFQWN